MYSKHILIITAWVIGEVGVNSVQTLVMYDAHPRKF